MISLCWGYLSLDSKHCDAMASLISPRQRNEESVKLLPNLVTKCNVSAKLISWWQSWVHLKSFWLVRGISFVDLLHLLSNFSVFFLHLLVWKIWAYQPDVTDSSIRNGALGVGFASGRISHANTFLLLENSCPTDFPHSGAFSTPWA